MYGNLKLTSKIPFAAAGEAVVSGGLMGAVIDVGEVYVQLVRDLREGTYTQTGNLNTFFTMLVSSTL